VAELTLQGPADVWFGVGFNATTMGDLPYAIVVSPTSDGPSTVTEHKLGNHDPGHILTPSLTLVKDTVTADTRTITLKRSLAGLTKDHFTFVLGGDGRLSLISAVGSSPTFAYHKAKSSSPIFLTNDPNTDDPSPTTCLCENGVTGAICGNAEGGCLSWSTSGGQDLTGARCPNEPLSDLLAQNNPTCFLSTYKGGLGCCHHLNILLDKDQNPWPDKTLHMKLKFRFYYQPFTPATSGQIASHQDLIRFYWQTESFAGEYDIPQGQSGSPGLTLGDGGYVHTITSHWKVRDMVWGCDPRTSPDGCSANATGVNLIYAGGHCHAPSCLSIELYNNDTGALLCRQWPIYGQGNVTHDRFDEKGYVALPPCLWGATSEGLASPVTLSFDTNLRSVKHNNATYGHYGEMASWQMRGVLVY